MRFIRNWFWPLVIFVVWPLVLSLYLWSKA